MMRQCVSFKGSSDRMDSIASNSGNERYFVTAKRSRCRDVFATLLPHALSSNICSSDDGCIISDNSSSVTLRRRRQPPQGLLWSVRWATLRAPCGRFVMQCPLHGYFVPGTPQTMSICRFLFFGQPLTNQCVVRTDNDGEHEKCTKEKTEHS